MYEVVRECGLASVVVVVRVWLWLCECGCASEVVVVRVWLWLCECGCGCASVGVVVRV